MVVNVPGKGNAGKHNGVNGDIQVFITEEQNDVFVRDGNDLIYNLLLDFPTAALGGEVLVPTVDGHQAKVTIQPGTQPGTVMRLRGKGLPAVSGYGYGTGDILINVSIYVPKTLSKDERKAIEALRDSENFAGDKQTKKSIFDRFKNYF
jgi:molecular chaperone DnaJ